MYCQPTLLRVDIVYTSLQQSRSPEDGRNYRPKHVELIEIINKLLLLHPVGCLHCCINDVRSHKYKIHLTLLLSPREWRFIVETRRAVQAHGLFTILNNFCVFRSAYGWLQSQCTELIINTKLAIFHLDQTNLTTYTCSYVYPVDNSLRKYYERVLYRGIKRGICK